jgi:MFS family permease
MSDSARAAESAAEDHRIAKTAEQIPAYAWYALLLLTLVYTLNFLDRALIYILFTPIKAEMRLTDTQLALLGTTSFVIFYTLLGIPFGRMADRVSRRKLIAAGLAVWSLFSGLTGFATDFWTIFGCRVMVGVGEATLGPAALSLLSDYFPPRVRATVQAVYSSGIAIGGGIASFLGGYIGQHYGWRWAFYLLGFPGLFFAVLVLLLKERPRGQTETAAVSYRRADWKILFRSTPLRYLYAGYALFGLAANSLSIWGPTFFVRVHGMSLAFIGLVAGILSVTAGVPGTILGGNAADSLRRWGRGGRMFFSAGGALCAIFCWIALLFSSSTETGLLLLASFILLALSLVWLGPAAADVHEIAGPQLRGLGIGIYFFAVNITAYAIGAPFIGKLNDLLGAESNPQRMRFALLICPLACAASAVLLWLGGKRLQQESA